MYVVGTLLGAKTTEEGAGGGGIHYPLHKNKAKSKLWEKANYDRISSFVLLGFTSY